MSGGAICGFLGEGRLPIDLLVEELFALILIWQLLTLLERHSHDTALEGGQLALPSVPDMYVRDLASAFIFEGGLSIGIGPEVAPPLLSFEGPVLGPAPQRCPGVALRTAAEGCEGLDVIGVEQRLALVAPFKQAGSGHVSGAQNAHGRDWRGHEAPRALDGGLALRQHLHDLDAGGGGDDDEQHGQEEDDHRHGQLRGQGGRLFLGQRHAGVAVLLR